MDNKLRIFAVSDIHGHCALLIEALREAGFDENNENHLFVCCGDLFDRGKENRDVYEFVCGLKNKVLIRGNHDERLAEILNEGRLNVYDMHNGTDTTLRDFFGFFAIDSYGNININGQEDTARELCELIASMANYYEIDRYVFTHGWLPLNSDGQQTAIRDDWRTADSAAWRSARFEEWFTLYNRAMLAGKTIVCGHRPTRFAERFDRNRSPLDSKIFYGSGLIAIDAGTVRSGRVNVLVLDIPQTEGE